MSARPNSSLLCYTDVVRINNSRQGIQAQAIERDVDLLLTLFVAQEKHDFSNFVNAWRKLDFASIHYACMYPESREAFMQAIYDAILDHFGSNIRAKKIGVIYALYFMYKTQPSALPTAYIRVTMETYSALIDYYEYCVLSGRTDLIKVASVIYEMKMEYAICIVARPAMMPANHKEIAELEKNIKLLEEIRDFKKKKYANDALGSVLFSDAHGEYIQVSKKYQALKNAALKTANAKVIARKMFRKKTTINTNDLRDVEKTLRSSVLSANEYDFLTTLKEAKHALLDTRLRSLGGAEFTSDSLSNEPQGSSSR